MSAERQPAVAASARRVLVTGAGGPSGIAAIAALKSYGYHVTAVDMHPVEQAADAFFVVPPASDPQFIADLRSLLLRERIDWLFPTVTEELVPIARAAPYLRSRGIAVFISDPHAVAICNDKWHTTVRLASQAVPVPRSTLTEPHDLAPALGRPFLSKPRIGRGGRGVVIHDAPGIAPATREVIWQEFVPGTEYDVVLLLHPTVPHEVLCLQVLEKTELRQGRVGNAVQVRAVIAEDVAAVAFAAARALSLCGPLDIDVRRDATGTPRVLEINARIGANSPHVPALFERLVELDREARQ